MIYRLWGDILRGISRIGIWIFMGVGMGRFGVGLLCPLFFGGAMGLWGPLGTLGTWGLGDLGTPEGLGWETERKVSLTGAG